MTKTLTPDDVRDLLAGFAAAIELDQLRVDALPPHKLRPPYSDSMWRMWRQQHLDYIDQLLRTVDAIPLTMLEELAVIAISCTPELVQQAALNVLAGVVSESFTSEEFETASLFFGELFEELNPARGTPRDADARGLMLQWLPVTDPLGIAQDPECGYGQPVGLVS
jgi:hypothetical protein